MMILNQIADTRDPDSRQRKCRKNNKNYFVIVILLCFCFYNVYTDTKYNTQKNIQELSRNSELENCETGLFDNALKQSWNYSENEWPAFHFCAFYLNMYN